MTSSYLFNGIGDFCDGLFEENDVFKLLLVPEQHVRIKTKKSQEFFHSKFTLSATKVTCGSSNQNPVCLLFPSNQSKLLKTLSDDKKCFLRVCQVCVRLATSIYLFGEC